MSKRGPRFSEKERLAIVKEGEKNDIEAVCAKYDISHQSYRLWRYKANGIKPKKQRSRTEKLCILEECVQNGINQTCAAYGVDSTNYFRWKKRFGFTNRGPGLRDGGALLKKLLKMVRKGGTGNFEIIANLTDDQAIRMRRKKELHDPQP